MAELWMFVVLVVVVCLLAGLAGAGYSSSPALCAAVGVPYRPATTGYVRHSGGPAQPAEAASSTAYSPAATLSSSHYYYHILTLQNCSVCRVKYQGASDVKCEIVLRISISRGWA